MIVLILRIAALALRIVSFALLVYCIMSFVMPDHQLYRKLAYYMERILHPIRDRLYRWFPALRRTPVDFSPLVLWLLIDIALSLVYRLGRIL